MDTLKKYELTARERVALLLISLTAVALRVMMVWLNRDIPFIGDEEMFVQCARTLVGGGGHSYADVCLPCSWVPGMPTAARAPGAPFWLAFWFWLVGDNLTVPRMATALLSGLCTLPLFHLAALTSSKRAGFACALLWTLGISEVFSWYGAVTVLGEPLALALMILALAALVTSIQRGRNGLAGASGMALGLASLLRPPCMTLMAVVGLWAWKFSRNRQTARLLAIAAVVQVLTMLPWATRNYLVFGKFMPIGSYGGTNLYFGNNPQVYANKGAVDQTRLIEPEVRARMLQLPEVEASSYAGKLAKDYLINNPRIAAYLVMRRAVLLWEPSIDFAHPFLGGTRLDAVYALTLLAALITIWVFRQNPMVWLFALWSANFVWPHVLIQSHPRYRQMLDPTLMLLASCLLGLLWDRGKWWRMGLGGVAAAAILFTFLSADIRDYIRALI